MKTNPIENKKLQTSQFAFQKPVIQEALSKDNCAIFLDMGLGKTAITCKVASQRYSDGQIKVLILTVPTSLQKQWEEELHKHCEVPIFIHKIGALTEMCPKLVKNHLNILILSYGLFQSSDRGVKLIHSLGRRLQACNSDRKCMWVLDESASIKNRTSKRFAKLMNGKLFLGPFYSMVLTGTPMTKSPMELFSQYKFLDEAAMPYNPTKLQNILEFRVKTTWGYKTLNEKLWNEVKSSYQSESANRAFQGRANFDTLRINQANQYQTYSAQAGIESSPEIDLVAQQVSYRTGVGYHDVIEISKMPAYSPVKRENMLALLETLKPWTITLSKEEAVELPPKIFQPIKINSTERHKDYMAGIASGLLETVRADGEVMAQTLLTALLKARQVLADFSPGNAALQKPKINWLLPLIMDEKHRNSKVLIYSCFKHSLEYIYKFLRLTLGKQQVALITGDVPIAERREISKAFGIGKGEDKEGPRVLILNPSISAGLNLQACGLQIWYDRSFSVYDRLQAEDRSHRLGITGSPTIVDLYYDLKMESKLYQSMRNGKELQFTKINAGNMEDFLNEYFD